VQEGWAVRLAFEREGRPSTAGDRGWEVGEWWWWWWVVDDLEKRQQKQMRLKFDESRDFDELQLRL
jgi:hypothetical protein